MISEHGRMFRVTLKVGLISRKREQQAEDLTIKEKLMQEYQSSLEDLIERRRKAHQHTVKLQLGYV